MNSAARTGGLITAVVVLLSFPPAWAATPTPNEGERLTNASCQDCHEKSRHDTAFADDLSHSVHRDLGCLDCHVDKDVAPHPEKSPFRASCQGCRSCHETESRQYQAHGRAAVGKCDDIPTCASCHGDHDILPSSVKASRTHPANLPATCGSCHEDLNLIKKYDILLEHPIEVYSSSVHGKASQGGIYVAATCNDCHSTGGSAHRILSPGDPESAINHFNIPATCGKCHKGVENDYREGIHGQRAARGETDVPVCTTCHGEHGIISPSDPRSPVSRARVAEQTCAPCHESATLSEKYGLPAGRLASFIDSYHGLKTKAGDSRVANCASCHGVHRILPSTDPSSTVHPANLRTTCGGCHPGISEKLAATPIHDVGGGGLRTPAAEVVAKIYIVAIVVIIGLMVVHWLLDLFRHIRNVMTARPQVVRMRVEDVWQHAFLTVSFIVLVISGFSLRYSESWFARTFFGWEGGFQLRGTVHRIAAVVFIGTVLWHVAFLASQRGRQFLKDMLPKRQDFLFFWQRIRYNLAGGEHQQCIQRFSYVEKAEYWALVWGTVVMVVTGFLLWFDNFFVTLVPQGVLDIALVVHFWEAWLATLAILVWHMYSVVFNPHVYPMNPSWLTGRMPEAMYRHEHPGHLEAAKEETAALLRAQFDRVGLSPEGAKAEAPRGDSKSD